MQTRFTTARMVASLVGTLVSEVSGPINTVDRAGVLAVKAGVLSEYAGSKQYGHAEDPFSSVQFVIDGMTSAFLHRVLPLCIPGLEDSITLCLIATYAPVVATEVSKSSLVSSMYSWCRNFVAPQNNQLLQEQMLSDADRERFLGMQSPRRL